MDHDGFHWTHTEVQLDSGVVHDITMQHLTIPDIGGGLRVPLPVWSWLGFQSPPITEPEPYVAGGYINLTDADGKFWSFASLQEYTAWKQESEPRIANVEPPRFAIDTPQFSIDGFIYDRRAVELLVKERDELRSQVDAKPSAGYQTVGEQKRDQARVLVVQAENQAQRLRAGWWDREINADLFDALAKALRELS